MKSKTKTGFIIFGIGVLISIIFMALQWFGIVGFGTDYMFIGIFGLVIGFFLIVVGGHMLKVRFNRWMDND